MKPEGSDHWIPTVHGKGVLFRPNCRGKPLEEFKPRSGVKIPVLKRSSGGSL